MQVQQLQLSPEVGSSLCGCMMPADKLLKQGICADRRAALPSLLNDQARHRHPKAGQEAEHAPLLVAQGIHRQLDGGCNSACSPERPPVRHCQDALILSFCLLPLLQAAYTFLLNAQACQCQGVAADSPGQSLCHLLDLHVQHKY